MITYFTKIKARGLTINDISTLLFSTFIIYPDGETSKLNDETNDGFCREFNGR